MYVVECECAPVHYCVSVDLCTCVKVKHKDSEGAVILLTSRKSPWTLGR
jgi:hypothetical protein